MAKKRRIKQERRTGHIGGGGISILNRVVLEGLTGKVTFK